MDEGTLNDLLECSVCLERLDTSSKVLPCQHTFCKKCLEEIVERHKELRCPECRILIHTKIDDLPPNVLLMRILEGMRNAAPKKQQRNLKETHQQNIQNLTPVHQINQAMTDHRHKLNKLPTHHYMLPHQAYAKALYDYSSKEPGDLNFKHGDLIVLRKRIDNNWYQGESGGKQGVFPISYVQIITPVPSHIPQCKALYDFRMTNDEEEGCLAFNKGDIINVIRRVDENWAEGKLDGKIGIFPLAFVELNSLARSLMKLSTNVQPGPSKVAPPTPTTEESSPLILTDHRRQHANVHVAQTGQHAANHGLVQQVQPTAGIPASDSSSTVSSGSSSTTTPNTTSSNNSSSSSTAPSSPASPPPRNQAVPPRNQKSIESQLGTPQRQINVTVNPPPARPDQSHQHNREKRHSFTSLTPQHHSANTHRHSAEILSPEASPNQTQHPQQQPFVADRQRRNVTEITSSTSTEQLPAAYIALYPYKPQKSDELELKKGGIYMVTERCQDGWFKGTSNRTQKCGVFPGNYVALARGAPRSPQTGSSRSAGDEGKTPAAYNRGGKSTSPRQSSNLPPELPPRSASPACSTNTISSSWHGQQDSAAIALGRSSSAIMSSVTAQSLSVTSSASSAASAVTKSTDKSKERKEKGTVSLMRRLTSIKRSKSPPPASYSMDNPVFEDSSMSTPTVHPVHVRSGSCPSQLLQQVQPADHRIYASTSQRLKHKERPSVLTQNPSRSTETPTGSSGSSPDIHHHRKSNSLDAGNKTKTGSQTVRERVRCIAPYPPNTEYELELQVNDIIYVCKKRDDGWYKGMQQRTGRTGLFPASFVEALK